MKKKTKCMMWSPLVQAGRTLALASCLGLAASAAQAQISMPGMLKDVMPRQSEKASGADSGTPAPQTGVAPGNAGAGASSTAQGPQGSFAFANKTLTGSFARDPGSNTQKSALYGIFLGGAAIESFRVEAWDGNGSHLLELTLETTLAKISKAPSTYTFRKRQDKPRTAEILYQAVGITCTASAGNITISTVGGVETEVTGTISGIEWNQPKCEGALGSSASFKVQRAVDYH